MRFTTKILALLLLISNAPGLARPLSEKERKTFVREIAEQADQTKTLVMDIEQSRSLLAFKDKLVSKGKFYLEAPNKICWQINEPYGSAIVYNGDKVAKFEKRDDQWKKLDHGGTDIIREIMSQISLWSKGEFGDDDMYDIQFFSDGLVTLNPKSADMEKILNKIELRFDLKTKLIKTVQLFESRGDYVLISFSNPVTNTKISDSIFSVKNKE